MDHLFLISLALGAGLVVFASFLRARRQISSEVARKLVHFAHTLVVAGWPIFFGYWFVIAGEILFIGAVLVSQEYRIFHDLRQIDRKTWGEFFLPIGVIWLALVAPPYWIFIACLLLLGMADGMAAIVGRKAKSMKYKVFGQHKSLAGTATFVAVASVVMLGVAIYSSVSLSPNQFLLTVIGIPLLAALAENLSPFGSDNISILVVTYFSLNYLGIFI